MRRRAALLAIVAALLLGGGALLFLFYPRAQKQVDMAQVLAGVDQAIAGGYLSTAADALRSMQVLPGAERDLVALLGRALSVSRLTGDYGLLADLGSRSLVQARRSAPIRTAAAYGALRAGRVAEARKILGGGPTVPDVGEALRAELALRDGKAATGADSLTRDVLALESSRDPALYAAAALRSGDTRLSLDAALLEMESGNASRAALLAQSALGDSAFDEPAAAICYDAGDFETAVKRLERLEAARPGRADVALFLADASRALGREGSAEASMLHALALAPGLSWTPYANLALLSEQRGDFATAARRLEDGAARFPDSIELEVAHAALYEKMGDVVRAISVLRPLADAHPDNPAVVLRLLALEAPDLSPEQYRGRLWRLFDRVPADGAVLDELCTALVAAHDWEGAAEALRQHEKAGRGESARLLLLQGMVEAMRGNMADAITAFSRSEALAKDGVARHNLALVLLRQGNARRAVTELAQAEESYARRGPPKELNAVLSRMEMARGSALMVEGDREGAREALIRSLSLDPRNLRASLLLRKLDAEGQ